MSTKLSAALAVAVLSTGTAGAFADLKDVDRTIKREPAYETKSPRYAVLVFGPQAKDRVWLVHDGRTLYVDRNGDGDLTRPDSKVTVDAHTPENRRQYPEDVMRYTVGDLNVGGRVHRNVSVSTMQLSLMCKEGDGDWVLSRPYAKAALAADKRTLAYFVRIDVDWPGLTGPGMGGRVKQMTTAADTEGALLFAARPADAPVIWLGGPLEITFDAPADGPLPGLYLDKDTNVNLVVGTRGLGPGTLAVLLYEKVIPDSVVVSADVAYPATKPGQPPVRKRYQLEQRC
jgi:hypothetical protein